MAQFPKLKLTYFNIPGRGMKFNSFVYYYYLVVCCNAIYRYKVAQYCFIAAEPIRVAFSIGGVPFEACEQSFLFIIVIISFRYSLGCPLPTKDQI